MTPGARTLTAAQPMLPPWVTPEILAVARALGWVECEEVSGVYAALDAVGREAEALGQRLSRDRSLVLAGPATLIAAVARRQVGEVLGTDLYPCQRPVDREWRIPRLHHFPAQQAAQILLQQVHRIALRLARAEGVPAPLRPRVLRTVASLLKALAHFEEAIHASALDVAPPTLMEWLAHDRDARREPAAAPSKPRARIQLTVLKAAVRECAEEVRMEVYDAYTLMAILWRGCRLLRWNLRRKGETYFLRPLSVTIVALRDQVRAARGKPWNTPYKHGLYGWDPSRTWLRLPPVEALDALREELRILSSTLMRAAEFLPDSWDAALSRCVGALQLAAAYLRDTTETAREETAGVKTGAEAPHGAGNSEKSSSREGRTVCDEM